MKIIIEESRARSLKVVLINESMNQLTKRPSNQPTNQPTYQPTNQSINLCLPPLTGADHKGYKELRTISQSHECSQYALLFNPLFSLLQKPANVSDESQTMTAVNSSSCKVYDFLLAATSNRVSIMHLLFKLNSDDHTANDLKQIPVHTRQWIMSDYIVQHCMTY